MTASSRTGIGGGAVDAPTNSELNTTVNHIFGIPQPSATYSSIVVTIPESDIAEADIILKDYLDNSHLTPCQIVIFISTETDTIAFPNNNMIQFNTIEMVDGETDLPVCTFNGGASSIVVVPHHSADHSLRVEISNPEEETTSGFYFGVLFSDGTYKISSTELILESSGA